MILSDTCAFDSYINVENFTLIKHDQDKGLQEFHVLVGYYLV